jgi:3-deoxy-D-manno-octulosonate 8-phosphate phosphatase KdsC-like HAD superfamily phosphatase
MGFEVFLVPAVERLKWASEKFNMKTLAYMGDSFQDVELLETVALGISPANGHRRARIAAIFVTQSPGGSRAVAEACGAIARDYRLTLRKLL